MMERNKRFYQRYPGDVETVRDIVRHLEQCGDEGVSLPSGGRLTTRRFLQSGIVLGSASGMDSLHWLLEAPWTSDQKDQLSFGFLKSMDDLQSYDTNPIYWLLHEAIYMDGDTGFSDWSAHRVGLRSKRDLALNTRLGPAALDYAEALKDADTPVFLNGEMVFPWMCQDYAQLRSLGPAADILAAKTDWSRLYNRDVLKDTKVPCAALISYDDIYVEREFSEETARLLGDNCQVWVTNEFHTAACEIAPDVCSQPPGHVTRRTWNSQLSGQATTFSRPCMRPCDN
eukprot:FR734624.1.p1 GENE.FR734624.1~~FR734624.1.p1  ORF type:complete len:314 (+),score=18.73 FR734624.1:90-944(+)